MTTKDKLLSCQGRAIKLNEEIYDCTCISCGSTEMIQVWPHRNGHGNLIGFVFACKSCEDILPDVSFAIYGIRAEIVSTMEKVEGK